MRSRAVVAAAVLTTALISGAWLMERGSRGSHDLKSGTRLFNDVVEHIRRDYVDTLADSVLYRHAIDGALRELHDPHSVFLDPRRAERLEESARGEYAGVGIQVDVRDSGVTVIGTLPGTPAEQAGILTGDRIVTIDGKSTAGLTADEALKALRGEAGTQAKVLVERAGVAERMPFTLMRRKIEVNPVRYAMLLSDGVGYVDLTIFSVKAAADVGSAIDSLRKAGATSIVLDLRGDPGGLLDQGVDVADLFLNAGQPIVAIKGRTPEETKSFADRTPQRWPDMPLVVLTDSATASASEIVAGALQDHDRAAVVGTTTFGKGSAQRLFRMSEEGALKLTIALWYTPSGRSINKRSASQLDDEDDGGNTPPNDSTPRPKFRTDGGRTVLGGGGIVPDVIVPRRAVTPADRALQAELGAKVPKFRDAINEYAISLRATNGVTDPNFTVTPVMRDELYRRLQQRGVPISRTVYDSDSLLVTRALTSAIARYVFGARVEFTHSLRDDATMTRALELLKGVRTQRELLDRLTKLPATTPGTPS